MTTKAFARLGGLGLLALVLCAGSVAAQATTGSIQGVITDSQGAAIPGATVTAQNVGTNATRTQQSNEVGAFAFPAMPPGAYLVKAELQGLPAGAEQCRASRRGNAPCEPLARDRWHYGGH